MSLFRCFPVSPLATAVAAAAVCMAAMPVLRAQDHLTPAQEMRLKKYLPRTYAKFQRRESVRVVVIGDSISAFYQPEGVPRYDSAMSWEGRLLSRLSGYFSYHDTVFDVVPHQEITASRKQSEAEWDKYLEVLGAWEKSKKGHAPEPPDTFRFRADSTASNPVLMNVGELVRRGVPDARQPEEGTSVWIYNMARQAAQASQAMESLTTSAFPAAGAGPDLVTICYGMNESLTGSPLAAYRAYLDQAVKFCQSRGVDVLVATPPVGFDPDHPRESLGRSRPYAAVAREVSEALGVFCVDLGAANVWAPSDLFHLTATDAFAAALPSIQRQFAYDGGVRETLHPNSSATQRMGDLAARELLGKPLRGPVQADAVLDLTKGGKNDGSEAELTLRLVNPTAERRTVVASVLSFPGWQVKPGTPDALFNLGPQKARRMKIPMVRAAVGTGRVAESGGFPRGSVLLSDDEFQQVVDVTARQQPLAMAWPEGRLDRASGEVALNPTLTNTSAEALKASARVQWMGHTTEVPVSVEAGKTVTVPIKLALPEGGENMRFLEAVTVSIESGGVTSIFEHEIEGIRNVALDQRTPMVPLNQWSAPAPANDPTAAGAWVTAQADQNGLWFFIEAPATVMPARQEGKPWGVVEVQLDGRKPAENGTLGFAGSLIADVPWTDGEAPLRPVSPAVFGNGYNYNYHPGSFRARVSTRADGSRRIEFAIMRSNLAQHEWSLGGGGQNTLGFNVRLNVAGPDGLRNDSQSSAVTFTDFAPSDARSLTVLELSRTPVPKWSLRIF